MKKLLLLMIAVAMGLVSMTATAGVTSTFLARRLGNSAEITPGKWHRDFNKAKKYAVDNGIPFVAVWSNGDACSHCIAFEKCLNTTTFKNYEKSSGIVFWFGYPGDSEYKIESKAFHWTRNNTNTSFPFVRIYWPKGKVDYATVGDVLDGKSGGGSESASTLVKNLKAKLSKYVPKVYDQPYTIAYDVNLPDGYEPTDEDVVTMDPVDTIYTETVTANNAFVLSGKKFIGWGKTAGASTVAYADGAALRGLTTVSNQVVTLYAQWASENYSVLFDANYTPTEANANDVLKMDSATLEYGVAATLPANAITRQDYAFSGWATTPTGAVAYKNLASVKNLTRGDSVTLYAKWTRTTYRTYYTGKKYTISTGLKGYAAKTTFPGMTWASSTGKFSGTPKTANTTDPLHGAGLKIKFVKGKTTVYRYFVVVKDVASLEGEGMTGKTVELTTSDADKTFAAVAVSGTMSNVKVTGLPDGMEYSAADNAISGRPTKPGSYTVKVSGTSAQGQALSATYTFKVKEGNQLVIGNFVHADKMFLNAGDDLDQLLNFLDADNKPYEIDKAEVQVLDAAGDEAGQVSTVRIDSTEGIYSLAGTVSEPGTYKLVITVTSADESPAVLTQNLKLVVLPAPESEEP